VTARLPIPDSDNDAWGTILNDYLQQAVGPDGTLVTAATNPYTGLANTNLASIGTPGLVQLAGDLAGTSVSPTVTGLQGRDVDSGAPADGDVLTWVNADSKWEAQAATGGTGGGGFTGDVDAGDSTSNYGGVATIDCGDST
jgi:hypothetical protein